MRNRSGVVGMNARLCTTLIALGIAACAAPAPVPMGWPPGSDADWDKLEKAAKPAKKDPLTADTWSCDGQPGTVCQIDIAANGANCQPTQMKVHVGRDTVILWKLSTPGWKFRGNGIEFKVKRGNPDPADGFEHPAGGGRKTFAWHARSTAPAGYYDYWVRLEDPSGKPCDADPGLWV